MTTTDDHATPAGQDPEAGGDDHAGEDVSGASAPADGLEGVADEDAPRSNREAAYRIKLRDAEAAAVALEERVTRMQRREVERLAREMRMRDPQDIWRYDVDLADLLDEETGELEEETVALYIAALAEGKPHLFTKRQSPPSVPFGQGAGHAMSDFGDKSTSWRQVLTGDLDT